MIRPSIKTITVKNLTNFLLLLSLAMLVVTGWNFRSLSITAVENKALALAEVVKSGLTSHMKAGIMDKRDYYLEEIRQVHRINELHIIRGDHVTKQFGTGHVSEKSADSVTHQSFTNKQPTFILDEFKLNPAMRVIVPYIASSAEGLNCLGCHNVSEGTVLGAVDIEIDVTDYRNMSVLVLGGLSLLAIMFLSLMIVNTSRTIQRLVKEPLESLIANAKLAYHSQKPVNIEHFNTAEFVTVANEINQFNTEIVAHQNMLREKNKQLVDLNEEIESTLRETVYTMGVIEGQRSQETNFHTKRVSLYSHFLAKQLGMTDEDAELVMSAAPLHDIGKLGIPDAILLKPGKLDAEERKIMQSHPRIGYDMLKHSNRDMLKAGAYIALHHHEKWDGSGYPKGLKGDEIHIFGRIVALADVFDALYSSRVYKKAWNLETIIDFFTEERGRHFDPHLVDIFMANVEQFVAIYEQYNTDLTEAKW
jgi:response regulator RpfG family c-di-GMP phosphodiesterase